MDGSGWENGQVEVKRGASRLNSWPTSVKLLRHVTVIFEDWYQSIHFPPPSRQDRFAMLYTVVSAWHEILFTCGSVQIYQ